MATFAPPLRIDDVNIASSQHKANPYPFYARLRESAPVCEVSLSRHSTAWLIARYADVQNVLRSEAFAKDRFRALSVEQVKKQPWVPGFARPLLDNMLDKDPPDHSRLRTLVQKAFTPRLVETMRPRIERLANDLLMALRRQQEFDLIADYALPIPTTIIAELLGVPAQEQAQFHHWSGRIVTSNASSWAMLRAIPALWQFLRYVRKLVARKRLEPGEDLISELIAAEEEGQRLNADEMVAMVFLLLIAGHETTVNLIGNGLLALLEHPEQHALLRERPELAPLAVEEMLRFESPLETATERYATQATEVAGVLIPQGSLVFAGLASANRDEQQFESADTFDLTREPNRHLSFGLGPHYCVGAPLARLEGQIAVATLMRHSVDLRLSIPRSRIKWRPGLVLRGMHSLPVSVSRWR